MKALYRKIFTAMIAFLIIIFSSLAIMAASPDASVSSGAGTQGVATQGAVTQGVAVTGNNGKEVAATVQKAEERPNQWKAPSQWFVYTIIGVVLFGSFLAILFIRAALSNTNWNLGDALSEEVEISLTTNADGKKEVRLDASGKPTMVTEMSASVSRLIAMMGMMVILFMFIGFGTFTLYSYSMTGEMPLSTDMVIKFLAGGLTLFAPYLVNKFASIFETLSPKAK